jgi:hypothetical protein
MPAKSAAELILRSETLTPECPDGAAARHLGVAPAGGPYRLTAYKSDWQISGKRQLPALGQATDLVPDPA